MSPEAIAARYADPASDYQVIKAMLARKKIPFVETPMDRYVDVDPGGGTVRFYLGELLGFGASERVMR